jgi:uncharacterized LabA/DUF88 family protein
MQLMPKPHRDNQLLKSRKSESLSEQQLFKVVEQPYTEEMDSPYHQGKPHFSPPQSHHSYDYERGEMALSGLSDRVAIFIDGANLFYGALQLNLEVDYAKLLRCLTNQRQLLRAYFYTGVDSHNDKQHGFILWMRRNGYRVFTKDLIHTEDGSKKVNLDVEMTVDMLTLAQYCNTLVVLSGSGDLAYALNRVAYQGLRIEVVSLRSMTSESLINVADNYIDLKDIKDKIQK